MQNLVTSKENQNRYTETLLQGNFAGIRKDGTVIVWNNRGLADFPDSIEQKLNGTSPAVEIFSSTYGIAVLHKDGSLSSSNLNMSGYWMSLSGESNINYAAQEEYVVKNSRTNIDQYQSKLNGNVKISKVYSYRDFSYHSYGETFIILLEDGSVIGGYDDNNKVLAEKLNGNVRVIDIYATSNFRHSDDPVAYLALREDGSVVIWGKKYYPDVSLQLDGTIDVIDVTTNDLGAVAALRSDGSVVAFGGEEEWGGGYVSLNGGDISKVKDKLNGAVKVTKVFPINRYDGHGGFAAQREDGSLVIWGGMDGNETNIVDINGTVLSSVNEKLNNIGNTLQVCSTTTCVAVLKDNGSVVTWGKDLVGTLGTLSLSNHLDGTIKVKKLYTTEYLFAALREDGSVVTWGADTGNFDQSLVNGSVKVKEIYSNGVAFAALREDGSVVTWGSDRFSSTGLGYGADSRSIQKQLDGTIDVVNIISNIGAFAALREDGSVVTWGSKSHGGDSRSVADLLNGSIKVTKIYTDTDTMVTHSAQASFDSMFSAVREDGSVVVWGGVNNTGYMLPNADIVSFLDVTTNDSYQTLNTSSNVLPSVKLPPVNSIVEEPIIPVTFKPESKLFVSSDNAFDVAFINAIDFNLDNKMDLVVTNSFGISLFTGDGQGNFSFYQDISTGSNPNYIEIADLNSDGKKDLVVINHQHGSFQDETVSILLNNGKNGFSLPQNVVVGYGPTSTGKGDYYTDGTKPNAVTIGDFNNDGKSDLVVLFEYTRHGVNGQASLLLGDGNGGFSSQTSFSVANDSNYVLSVSSGDLNLDGKLDLVVTRDAFASVLLGNGLGGFSTPVDYRVGAYPHDSILGDFDSDGNLDIVTANYNSDTISLLLGDGSGKFATQSTFSTGYYSPFSIRMGDFNSDGKLDIVVTNKSDAGKVSLLLGDGKGGFSTPILLNVGNNPTSVVVGDFNSDDSPDIATANVGGVRTVNGYNIWGDFSILLNTTFSPSGEVLITGDTVQNRILTANNTLADSKGVNNLNYKWFRDGLAITNANLKTYTVTQEDVGKNISVSANYNDGTGKLKSVISDTIKIVNANDLPTGSVIISGEAQQGKILSASNSLADLDGLGIISYQWLSNGNPISGANQSTYILTGADVGKAVSVKASYTDLQGTAESVTSNAIKIVNANDLPTGSVIISGEAQQGKTLTVSNTLADADGLGVISYQWLSNGNPISGANQSTYTLTGADVGKAISVKASYTDLQGTAESVTSNAVKIANVNDLPTGNITISGEAQQGKTLTASNTLADADGLGVISYQWLADEEILPNAIQPTYNLTQADVGKNISVSASYSDDFGQFETVTSESVKIANLNDAPTGRVNIKGTAKVGQTLFVANTLKDADGLGEFSYQWFSNNNEIIDATAATYTLSKFDAGKKISVEISYTDGEGAFESVTSSTTATIKPANNGVIKIGDDKNNKLQGAIKNDDLEGLAGKDVLIGKAGNDTLNGGDDDDSLTGDAGFDVLIGGKGADVFIFTNIKDALVSRSGIDVITDFNSKEGDKIDLSKIDADATKSRDQAFSKPTVGEKFSGIFVNIGDLFFETSTEILYGNVNKDGAADFAIQLNGVTSLAAGDVVL